ncbi:MAG: hypothetical protein AAF602_19585 [Myxococcota bacterium]
MAFQQQQISSIWVRTNNNRASNEVAPEDALTEPAAPPRSATPATPPMVDFDEQVTITDDRVPHEHFELIPEALLLPDPEPEPEPVRPPRSMPPGPLSMPPQSISLPPQPLRVDSTLSGGEESVEGLKKPSSAVRCAIPVTLRMLTGNPRALVTLLDVDRVVVQAEHALPDQATVWVRLPFSTGAEVVRGRVTTCDRRTPTSPWEALVKLEVSSPATRRGLVGLVRSLKERTRR